jgi:hypothetical protein
MSKTVCVGIGIAIGIGIAVAAARFTAKGKQLIAGV